MPNDQLDPITRALRQSLGLEPKDETPSEGRTYTSSGYVDKKQGVISHYGVVIDAEKPTTGVVSINSAEYIDDEMFGGDAIDLAWEEHQAECKGMCAECHCSHYDGGCDCHFPLWNARPDSSTSKDHEYDPTGEHDGCGPEERGTILIGSWKKDEDGLWVADESGEYSAIVGETDIQVVWSRHVKHGVNLCSPCYPGQADLGSKGEVSAYCLPPELMGEEEPEDTNAKEEEPGSQEA